jgi:hypothetical protein
MKRERNPNFNRKAAQGRYGIFQGRRGARRDTDRHPYVVEAVVRGVQRAASRWVLEPEARVPPVGAARGLPLAIEVDAEREESDAEREISNPLGHFSGERFRGKRAIPGSIQGVLSAPGGWLNGEITRKGDFSQIEPKYVASGHRLGRGYCISLALP